MTPTPEVKLLPMSKAGGSAVKALIVEINEAARLLDMKQREMKRLTDIMQSDAGMDPDVYNIVGTEDGKDGIVNLKMHVRPQPIELAPSKEPQAKEKPIEMMLAKDKKTGR